MGCVDLYASDTLEQLPPVCCSFFLSMLALMMHC